MPQLASSNARLRALATLAPGMACLAALTASAAFVAMTSPDVIADAKTGCRVRVIHTNDLHSQFAHSHDPARGGYAAIKATIDDLKKQSEAEGVPTLVLDAGDFSEGSAYYLADGGKLAFEVMNEMGYDAVTIGNHDWLMGIPALDRLVGEIKPRFAFLGANFHFGNGARQLRRHMRKSTELTRGGTRFAILGLTTAEDFYSWRLENDGDIADPLEEARQDVPVLRSRNDFVIALTHLGLKQDRRLVANTRGIDLVVGGHTHEAFDQVRTAQDPDGRDVGVVQTGALGENVGDLVIDACPGEPLRIVSYRLVPVLSAGRHDAAIDARIGEAAIALTSRYSAIWLNEIIGQSDVPLSAPWTAPNEWGDLVADSLREAGQADVAIDFAAFTTLSQPPGPIRRSQLLELYPRMFETDRPMGWTVWTTELSGYWLRKLLALLVASKKGISASGLSQGASAQDIRINGAPLSSSKTYRLALPEGALRGLLGMAESRGLVIRGLTGRIFTRIQDTGIPVWTAIEDHLKARDGRIQARVEDGSRAWIHAFDR